MTTVPDTQYLSIGEVLGLLLEDFPDVTISKIRFLESQGLIEPERTPSGYRKFYDHDVELLRTILHEQKANFLPLKVIRDRIESGAIDSDTAPRTPPKGIRNVEVPPEQRDSVFRRTDGGPEWAGGRALIPGDDSVSSFSSSPPITEAVPVTPAKPASARPAKATVESAAVAAVERPPIDVRPVELPAAVDPPPTEVAVELEVVEIEIIQTEVVAALIEVPPEPKPKPAAKTQPEPKSSPKESPPKVVADDSKGLPYDRAELCASAGITLEQLGQLEEFGIIISRGSGSDVTYHADALEIAKVAGQFMEQGIDPRHLRGWRQAAERESALYEQRIMPLLRQRNPQSRQLALDSLTELAELGSRFRNALVASLLRHHFDGG